jgi:hypothetical protein
MLPAMIPHLLARLGLPLLRLGDRRPATPAAQAAAQERIRRRLMRTLAPLPVGRARGLDSLDPDDLAAFRARVPVSGYADYEALIAQVAAGGRSVMFPGRTLALAQTSGTTRADSAGERYIPQSRALLAHHRRGGAAAFTRLLEKSGGGVLGGRLVMMGGSTDLAPNAHGVPAGDLSGIVVEQIPSFLRGLYEPGPEIARERDWPAKMERMVARLKQADVRLVSGIGSWMLVLFDRVCAATGHARIADAWPGLRACIHGGHAVAGVLPQFRRHLHPDTWLMEVYPASEAFIAVGSRPWRLDEGDAPPLAVLADHGVVVEFLPDDDPDPAKAVGPDGLEAGRTYRVLLTTPGGLVRYQPGDLARGEGPGLIRVAGRTATRISVFGEHVEGLALTQALAAACAATGAAVDHWHVAPLLPAGGDPRGGHEWWLEFRTPPADRDGFAAVIDRHLCEASGDYAAHRAVQLHPPRLHPVPPGTFERWLAAKGKLGGQHKVPVAWNDRTIADALARAAGPA